MRTSKHDYKTAIRKILLQHKGQANAIKCKSIKDILAKQDIIASPELTRFYINSLIMEENLPILSCEKGYFWASTQSELKEHINFLQSYVNGLNQKIDILSQYIIGE